MRFVSECRLARLTLHTRKNVKSRNVSMAIGVAVLVLAGTLAGALVLCHRQHSACASGDAPYACADVAIVTVIPEEYVAMTSKLATQPVPAACAVCTNAFRWVYGTIPAAGSAAAYRVVVGIAGEAGTTSGALATAEAIRLFAPRYVLLVGVAGGMPGKLREGDLLLAKSIWGYDYGAVRQEFEPRLDFTFRADPRLLAAAAGLDDGWRAQLTVASPVFGRVPQKVVGQAASGNKVIENVGSAFWNGVLSVNDQIAGIEMEGAGAAAAVELARTNGSAVGFLMIRGISDVPADINGPLTEKKDREKWKVYAADVAATFAHYFIAHAWPEAAR